MHRKSPQMPEREREAPVLPSFPVVLKNLLENPPQKLLESEGKDEGKEKNVDEAASSTTAASASLMPTIWDKTIPYDGETFHLEYMDLDEFLLENGIPDGSNQFELQEELQVGLLPVVELEEKVPSPTLSISGNMTRSKVESDETGGKKSERKTPNSVDLEDVDILVNFEPDPTDLALSSVPGGELFNPRKHKFSDEELKPQPMIKKAKKVYVPPEQKDDRYWARRKKNNVAAKRSRDARRLKENQITVRAAFLEKENSALRLEVVELRNEVARYKSIISKYRPQWISLRLIVI
ncbi:thyrotroph embryonic factor-like isoform X2 [Chiloscyllium plagiosum]|uniref:thyrotroph embryonic factor-like isoform X2 n=1 Tax=Chiloscyllium plagiosum TaxID=36176 RepID=UPI001CB7DFA0|nr:thyrotroph embryonic factor-like isoform X2 [Chiloscyllium plagiosum]